MGSGVVSTLRQSSSTVDVSMRRISEYRYDGFGTNTRASNPSAFKHCSEVGTEPEKQIIIKYPSYYVTPIITDNIIKNVRKSWKIIIEDDGIEYNKKKRSIDATSCWSWFYMLFYDELFERLPEVKKLFIHDVSMQGKALIGMISMTLGLANKLNTNLEEEKRNFEKLATRHVYYGVTVDH